MAEPCLLARELLGEVEGTCRALEFKGNRYYCGLVKRPAFYMFNEVVPKSETGQFSVFLAAALGLGTGCDSL